MRTEDERPEQSARAERLKDLRTDLASVLDRETRAQTCHWSRLAQAHSPGDKRSESAISRSRGVGLIKRRINIRGLNTHQTRLAGHDDESSHVRGGRAILPRVSLRKSILNLISPTGFFARAAEPQRPQRRSEHESKTRTSRHSLLAQPGI